MVGWNGEERSPFLGSVKVWEETCVGQVWGEDLLFLVGI